MRTQFDKQLNKLQTDVLDMGKVVEDQLKLALKALKKLDIAQAKAVCANDEKVNAHRLAIEEKCFRLIVTQQPAARDLRAIIAVNMMIVDLERMGDQAKNIGRIIPMLANFPKWTAMVELQDMGDMVGAMLHQSMDAYAHHNLDLANFVTNRDSKVDELFDSVVTKVMEKMASTQKQKKVKAAYDVLSIARALERFGDQAVNIAERVVYISTGTVTI